MIHEISLSLKLFPLLTHLLDSFVLHYLGSVSKFVYDDPTVHPPPLSPTPCYQVLLVLSKGFL